MSLPAMTKYVYLKISVQRAFISLEHYWYFCGGSINQTKKFLEQTPNLDVY